MATRLTVLAVEKTKGGTSRREIPDGGCAGLYLVVQPGGAKSWAIRCRLDGKPSKVTLGRYPQLDLAAAREEARKALAMVDAGGDPRQHRAEQRQAQASRRANTMRAVAEQFRDAHMKRVRPRSWQDSWSALDRHVLASLGDRPITSIRRRDLHEVLDPLAGMPGAHHHTISVIASLFRWLIDREILESNPADRLPRLKPRARERALSDEELPVAWRALEQMSYPVGPLMRLLLLTGCRRGEIAELRWEEVDLDKNLITLPSERYKTGKAMMVPLSTLARQLIGGLPRHGGGDYVFSCTGGRRPLGGFTKVMKQLDLVVAKQCEEEGRAAFTFDPHDLRRTLRTGLAALRVPSEVAEACLGHVVGGVQRHYNMHRYLTEKAEALEAWSRRIENLLNPAGSNVVQLRSEATY